MPSILRSIFSAATEAPQESPGNQQPSEESKWSLSAWIPGLMTRAGEPVSPEAALRLGVYFACVRVVSEDVACLPLNLMRKIDGGKKREAAKDHPAFPLLNEAPNEYQTAYSFREVVTSQAVSWGNGYAEIVREDGIPSALIAIHSSRVQPIFDDEGRLWYKVRPNPKIPFNRQLVRMIRAEDMFHIAGLGSDGIVGYSVAMLAAETIGGGIAQDKFHSAFFGNGAFPGGILKHPKRLSSEAHSRLRDDWSNRHRGSGNAYKPAILEDGMEWVPTMIPQRDAQFIESKDWTVEDICRWFRVNPAKVQHLKNAGATSYEQQNLTHLQSTLGPWLKRWEEEASRKLLFSDERELSYRHNTKVLLRSDSVSRSNYYRGRFMTGTISPNEIRALEDEEPIEVEGADSYFIPLNLRAIDEDPKEADKRQGENNEKNRFPGNGENQDDAGGDRSGPSKESSLSARISSALAVARPVVEETARRLLTREYKATVRLVERFEKSGDIVQLIEGARSFADSSIGIFEEALSVAASTIEGAIEIATGESFGTSGDAVQSFTRKHLAEFVSQFSNSTQKPEPASSEKFVRAFIDEITSRQFSTNLEN